MCRVLATLLVFGLAPAWTVITDEQLERFRRCICACQGGVYVYTCARGCRDGLIIIPSVLTAVEIDAYRTALHTTLAAGIAGAVHGGAHVCVPVSMRPCLCVRVSVPVSMCAPVCVRRASLDVSVVCVCMCVSVVHARVRVRVRVLCWTAARAVETFSTQLHSLPPQQQRHSLVPQR